MTPPPASPGRRLRDAWAAAPIAVPGVFNALVGRMAGRLGFKAMYLSGAALSASMGLPDVGLVTLTEFVEEARRLTAACSLPLAVRRRRRFRRGVERRADGAAVRGGRRGRHPPGGPVVAEALRPPVGQARWSSRRRWRPRCGAAAAARKDADFVIVARTDARGVHGFDDAVRRARLYLEAGADVIFPEALESAEEFAAFARAVAAPLLANMTEFGRGPILDFATLAAMGYRMVLYPVTALRAALRAAEATLAEILTKGHQRDALPRMLSRAELYDLLDYAGYEERDRTYFG